jgi:malonyl-CoA O-methyltransferase
VTAAARAFDRAADYDRHATVQRATAAALAARIAALPLPLPPRPKILEIGCGTGFLGAALLPLLPGADWLMTDIAPAMLARAATRFADVPGVRFAVMDGEAPDAAGPFDLICSSLAAQWFADLPGTLERLSARLAPGGRLAIATLADGSFAEWRAAHRALGLAPGTPDYPSYEALAALRPGGASGDIAMAPIVARHDDAATFLRALKAIGAGTARGDHRPLPPPALRAVMRRFEADGASVTYAIAHCLFERPA